MNEKQIADSKADDMADPTSGIEPKNHGHETLASLLAEIRGDEAAGREQQARQDGQDTLREILGGKTPAPRSVKDRDQSRGR